MGMFDEVIVDVNILPDLDNAEREILKEVAGWQTKSFECIMTNIYIVEDNYLKWKHNFSGKTYLPYKLQVENYEYETVPLEERPHQDMPFIGSMRKVNIKIEDLPYTGVFDFYTYRKGVFDLIWYECEAENGKIISIKKI